MNPSSTTLQHRLFARGKFRHIQVLMKLAELGSVQRAADSMGITQSAVTQTLNYLESMLEVQLFDRHARGVRPTIECQDLLPIARQLLQGISESAEAITARHTRGQSTIRLVSEANALGGILLPALPDFTEVHPEIQIRLNAAEGVDLLMSINRAEVDMAACRRPNVIPAGWTFTELFDDHFCVVCPVTHPLARPGRIAWKALGAHRWLLMPGGTAARARFDQLAEEFDSAPDVFPVSVASQ